MITLYRPDSLAWRETRDAGRLELSLAPNRWTGVPIALFALVWNAFLVVFVVASRGLGLVFGALHIFAGVMLARQAIKMLLGVSTVSLDRNGFEVKHAPLRGKPIWMPLENIVAFDVTQVSPGWFNHRDGRYPWSVRMLTRDHRAIQVELPLTDPEHVQFVAARLNAALPELREPQTYRDSPPARRGGRASDEGVSEARSYPPAA